jgi:hypothetical protein
LKQKERITPYVRIWPKPNFKEVTDGLLPPPAYFGMNVAMNKKDMIVLNRFNE